MTRPANRSELMDRLGAVQLNVMWSWCAVNESEKKVYFSIWTDNVLKEGRKTSYIIQEPDWGLDEGSGRASPARNDQDAKLSLVFDHGYEPYGYFIVAKDRTAHPREIAEARTSFIVQLDMARLSNGTVIGTPVRRIEIG